MTKTRTFGRFAQATAALILSAGLVAGGAMAAGAAPSSLGQGPTIGGTPVAVDGVSADFVQLATGDTHSLGLAADGTVYAWGHNGFGQLGDGTLTDAWFTPVRVLGPDGGQLGGIVQLAVGNTHSLALTADGHVYAWGANLGGKLGDGTNADSYRPTLVLAPDGSGPLTGVTKISGAYDHSMALAADGHVYTWGVNIYGRLGTGMPDGVLEASWLPVAVHGVGGVGLLSDIVGIGGRLNSLAVDSAGHVYSWGLNDRGQLGDGTTTNSTVPVRAAGVGGAGLLSGVVDLDGGFGFTVALADDGSVFSWGRNDFGQLGDGTIDASLTPVGVQTAGGPLTGVVDVSADGHASIARTADGSALAWGRNNVGQLGDGTTASSLRAKPVPGLPSLRQAEAGWAHQLALGADGRVYGWGRNDLGQLGDGTDANRASPVLGPNFAPAGVLFDGIGGLGLSSSAGTWSVRTPPHAAGTVFVVRALGLFAGVETLVFTVAQAEVGTFTYGDAPLITTPTLDDGTLGAGYDATIASDGTGPIAFAVTAGALPGGLTFDGATGRITGVPAAAGTATFTVTATNAFGSHSREYSILVPALALDVTPPSAPVVSAPVAETVPAADSVGALAATGSSIGDLTLIAIILLAGGGLVILPRARQRVRR